MLAKPALPPTSIFDLDLLNFCRTSSYRLELQISSSRHVRLSVSNLIVKSTKVSSVAEQVLSATTFDKEANDTYAGDNYREIAHSNVLRIERLSYFDIMA